MKHAILAMTIFVSLSAFGQASYFTVPLNSTSFVNGIKVLSPMNGATVNFCSAPANATPCTNYATVYTNSTATVAATNPITADPSGNAATWFLGNASQYQYTVTYQGQSFGPYNIPGGASSAIVNSVLHVGPSGGFVSIAAAENYAGSVNKTVIAIDSNYAGTECPSYLPNLTWLDYRGISQSSGCGANVIMFNVNDGDVNSMQRHYSQFSAIPNSGNGGVVTDWCQTQYNNGTGGGGTIDGCEHLVSFLGTLTGTVGNAQGVEDAVQVNTTGGTITEISGGTGYVSSSGLSTTVLTDVYGYKGGGCAINMLGVRPVNCRGLFGMDQGAIGSSDNFAVAGIGKFGLFWSSVTNVAEFDIKDSGGTNRTFFQYDGTNTNIQTVGTSTVFKDSGGTAQAQVSSAGGLAASVKFSTPQLILNGGTALTGQSGSGTSIVTNTGPTVGGLTVSSLTNGAGLQVFNTTTTCTTAASAGATCTTAAITLPVAEADTAYRISCTGKGPTNIPTIVATTNSSATQFTITIAAITAAAATYTSFDCIAGHN